MGCIFPSCLIVSLLAYIYNHYQNLSILQNILGCLRPAVVALIASAGLSILNMVVLNKQSLQLSHIDWTGTFLFLAAFAALRKLKWNPILVMCLCGGVRALLSLLCHI
jgi:chromate transporter